MKLKFVRLIGEKNQHTEISDKSLENRIALTLAEAATRQWGGEPEARRRCWIGRVLYLKLDLRRVQVGWTKGPGQAPPNPP